MINGSPPGSIHMKNVFEGSTPVSVSNVSPWGQPDPTFEAIMRSVGTALLSLLARALLFVPLISPVNPMRPTDHHHPLA